MIFHDAARLRYKITIPLILVLARCTLSFSHYSNRAQNLLDTQNLLSGLRTTSVEILTAPAGMQHESTIRIFKSILEELQSYPADSRLTNLLNNEESNFYFGGHFS